MLCDVVWRGCQGSSSACQAALGMSAWGCVWHARSPPPHVCGCVLNTGPPPGLFNPGQHPPTRNLKNPHAFAELSAGVGCIQLHSSLQPQVVPWYLKPCLGCPSFRICVGVFCREGWDFAGFVGRLTPKLNPKALNPTPSTLHPQPSTLNPTPSTLNPKPYTLNPQP